MDKYAVIGNPIEHSLSPQIHQAFANQAGISINYEKIKAPLDSFASTLKQFQHQGGKGCNVTLPFKEEAYHLADQLGENTKLAKSVNCIQFLEDGRIYGDNFDGVGLVQDLTQNKQISLNNANILILGAGGAARGIIEPLLQKGPDSVTITNRTFAKAKELVTDFLAYEVITAIPLEALPPLKFDLIINATSAGHQGKILAVTPHVVSDFTICYDLSYGKAAEAFLTWSKQHHCQQAFDGFGMLVEQAAASFYLWQGFYPCTEQLIKNHSY